MSQDEGKQQTGRISRVLKGIGVVLTVLSLISGVRSVTGLYLESRDASAATRSSLAAATRMAETHRYALAWQELERASSIVAEPDLLPYRVAVAMRWVEQLDVAELSEPEQKAVAARVLPYLYQALAEPTRFDVADVQAHIAWTTYVANHAEARPRELIATLATALRDAPEHANLLSMLGFLESRSGIESLDRVLTHFEAAPRPADDAWAARIQLVTFANLMAREIDRNPLHEDLPRLAGYALPIAVRQPTIALLTDEIPLWLWRLNHTEHVALVEQIATLAEPGPFLEFLDVAHLYSTPTRAANYLYVLLEERSGDLAAARRRLESFTDQWAATANPALLTLVQSTQARLGTAVASKPQHGRYYYSDERPADVDERSFHLDTLLHFDPDVWSDNLVEAVEYFDDLSAEQVTPELRAAALASRNRVKEYTDNGERWLLEANDDEDTQQELVEPRAQLEILWWLAGRLADIEGDYDTAIAEWTDAYSRWTGYVDIAWPLATAHASRAAMSSTPNVLSEADKRQSVEYLQVWIDWLRETNRPVPWERVHDEAAFAVLADNDAFRALVRGRE